MRFLRPYLQEELKSVKMKSQIKFQIGKSGVTEGVIQSLNNAFRTRKTVRISLLQSSGRDRTKMKEIANELGDKLAGNFKHTIVGFTIIMKKTGARKPENKR